MTNNKLIEFISDSNSNITHKHHKPQLQLQQQQDHNTSTMSNDDDITAPLTNEENASLNESDTKCYGFYFNNKLHEKPFVSSLDNHSNNSSFYEKQYYIKE